MVKNKKDAIAKIAPFFSLCPASILFLCTGWSLFPYFLNLKWSYDLLWPREHSRRDYVPAVSWGLRQSCMLLLASLETCCRSSNEPGLAFRMMRDDVAQSPSSLPPRVNQPLDMEVRPPTRPGQSPLSHQLTTDESVSPATDIWAGQISRTLKLTCILVSINKWYLFSAIILGVVCYLAIQ